MERNDEVSVQISIGSVITLINLAIELIKFLAEHFKGDKEVEEALVKFRDSVYNAATIMKEQS